MEIEYLTTKELAARIKYSPLTIRNSLVNRKFTEGTHYFRPFGGRKILFIWSAIEADMANFKKNRDDSLAIPMASGGYVCG
jgi:hypothetical protein